MDENTKHLVASNLALAQATSKAMIEAQKQMHANTSYFNEEAIFGLYQRYVARIEEQEKQAKA